MAKKKVAKKKTGKSMTSWQSEMAEAAKKEEAGLVGGDGAGYISIQGGEFTFRGEPMGDIVTVVILDHCFDNTYYEGAFDPDNPALPECFAVGRDAEEMVPGEAAPEKQADACDGCPMNEWGSADVGRGKACKNGVRLMVTPADNVNNADRFAENEVALLRLPPTSIKNFNGYVRKVSRSLQRPTYGVVTNLSLTKGKEKMDYKVVEFELVDNVPDECGPHVMDMREQNQETLLMEYTDSQYELQEEKAKQSRKPARRKAKKKAAKKKTAKKRF